MGEKKHLLWAPEIIKESNGIACGDMLTIRAYRDGELLFFEFSGNACKVALNVADYLVMSFSGKTEREILRNVVRLRNSQFTDEEDWIKKHCEKRKECVESPISLLYGIVGEDVISSTDETEKTVLACDACVSTKPVNWRPEKDKESGQELRDVAKAIKVMDIPEEFEYQKLALCVLRECEQEVFSRKFGSVSDKEFKMIKKLRLAVLLYNNAKRYNLTLDKRIEELAVKQIVSLNVANEEIKIVNQYIQENNLYIDAVKGGKTNQYYPEGSYRTHMDFDYLAANFQDAFKLIYYLINERKFKMVVGGSVPFSMKAILNADGEEVLTGHIHLEKILQNKYQVVVDINMGGFPLGRTGIIQCNKAGKIELEDLICITVAHLFKHEHAFMKDINDLYYLLLSRELNKDLLISKLDKYELTKLFMVVFKFLKEELMLEADVMPIEDTKFSAKRIESWPLSRKSHFYIKARDMLDLNIKKFGQTEGIHETIHQICGVEGDIETKKYGDLIPVMNSRIYLYPITIFNHYIEIKGNDNLRKIESEMFCLEQLLILPIGVFIIQNRDDEFSRNKLNDMINSLMENLKIDSSECNCEFVMEARKDTWLY